MTDHAPATEPALTDPATAAPTEVSSFRIVGSLVVAGLVSGLILVGAFLWTQPLIAANQAAALQAAIFRVVPGTTTTAPMHQAGDGVALVKPGGEVKGEALIYACTRKDGSLVGYAIPGQGSGFMDTISLLYGYDPGRKVIVGMEVLDSRETPGLGDKIITDKHFLENFKALAVEPDLVPVKRGLKTKPNEVDMITGASISSKAVVSILHKGNRTWLPRIGAATSKGGK